MAIYNYFQEYKEYIERLQNRLLEIQLAYSKKQSEIEYAYKNGEITTETYMKAYNARMDTFIDGVDFRYVLSKEEVEFVCQYGEVNSEGFLYQELLKPELLVKRDRMESIFDSVKRFAYLDTFSASTRRVMLKDEFVRVYSEKKSKLEDSLKKLTRIYGDNVQRSNKYVEICSSIESIDRALSAANLILYCDDAKFNELVASFYEVDYSYYEWFKNMCLRDEYKKGTIYDEQVQVLGDTANLTDILFDLQEEVSKNRLNTLDVATILVNFLVEIDDVDLTLYDCKQVRKGIFKKEVQDNREVLFELFESLSLISGSLDYIKSEFANSDEFDLKDCFSKYMTSVYGEDAKYIDLNEFLNTFRKKVTAFYKNLIDDKKKNSLMGEDRVRILTTKICSELQKSTMNAALIKEIHSNCDGSRIIFLDGFNEEETEKIFTSLKEMFFNKNEFVTDCYGVKKV